MVWPLWKTGWQFFVKVNKVLAHDTVVVLLGISPKELETYVHTQTSIWMFIAILFIISKTCRQPKCPLVSEWINKYPLIYVMHADSGIFINQCRKLSSHEKAWRNFTFMSLDGRSQSEKATV